jgi:hypothetical protein
MSVEKINPVPINGLYIDPPCQKELQAIEYMKKHATIIISPERLIDCLYLSFALETGKLHPDMEKKNI